MAGLNWHILHSRYATCPGFVDLLIHREKKNKALRKSLKCRNQLNG